MLASGTAVFVPRHEAVGVADAMIQAPPAQVGGDAPVEPSTGTMRA